MQCSSYTATTIVSTRMSSSLNLVMYDTKWPHQFAAAAARIVTAIGPHVIAVEHVGSTAVPGMFGKPVLDIGIAVADERRADACIAPLELLGYRYRGLNGDDVRRRYYVMETDGVRVAQLHLYLLPARGWDEQLAFRDALRADPTLAAAYADEKRRVAEASNWDKRVYANAKGPFVQQVLADLRRAGRLAPLPSLAD
jgi:GrpB-like predicted nucleotidyltransferase (UPF0157 family)